MSYINAGKPVNVAVENAPAKIFTGATTLEQLRDKINDYITNVTDVFGQMKQYWFKNA
jgi:hypothetical protein